MGDASFWLELEELCSGDRPLLDTHGELDATALRAIDRWIGGTHLQPGKLWRWDGIQAQLLRS